MAPCHRRPARRSPRALQRAATIPGVYRGEYFNSISHLVGAAFAVIGATVLITLSAVQKDAVHVVGVSIYGVTLVLLYLASTLYHSFAGPAKRVFQRLDHGSIYLLIAGTYTPLALVALSGSTGWILLAVVWGLAAFGLVVEALPIPGPRVLPVVIYLVMGWSCLFALDPLLAALEPATFYWLFAGGLFYTVGVVFFVLDTWFNGMHGVWHLFVIAGSVCHYVAILLL